MQRIGRSALIVSAAVAAVALALSLSRPFAAGAESKEPRVLFFDAREMADAFAKGRLVHSAPEYKIVAGHRDAPGAPEAHDADTDVFYILAGECTFVTGGKVIDARLESPGETRGSRIEGGAPRELKKGEVIVIPRGVPHWFSEVRKATDYFVVKVTASVRDAKAAK